MKDLLRILQELEQATSDIDTQNYTISYRGMLCNKWDLLPGIFRENRLEKETMAYNEVVRQYPEEMSHLHTIDVLTHMQHYDCPTRMLDVTSNFFVALFFACGGWEKVTNKEAYSNYCNSDGVIKIFAVPKEDVKTIDSETAIVLSNIARVNGSETMFKQFVWKCKKDQNGAWDSTDVDLMQKNAQDVNRVIFVKTKLNNPRVRAQFGEFFLFGGLDGIQGYEESQSLPERPIKKKIIAFPQKYIKNEIQISASQKEGLMRVLDKYFNINFSRMCPEKPDVIKTIIN